MRIALVMDDMPVRSNGTSSTALRYADALREQGHEVMTPIASMCPSITSPS